MTEYKRNEQYETKRGEQLIVINPVLSYDDRPTQNDIFEGFQDISWDDTKTTDLDNGHIIYAIALKVIKSKFGQVLYAMDYEKNIYKLNKSTLDWFKKYKPNLLKKAEGIEIDKETSIWHSKDEPLCCIYITGDGEYKGYDFKYLEVDWSHRDLSKFNPKIQKEVDRARKASYDN